MQDRGCNQICKFLLDLAESRRSTNIRTLVLNMECDFQCVHALCKLLASRQNIFVLNFGEKNRLCNDGWVALLKGVPAKARDYK